MTDDESACADLKSLRDGHRRRRCRNPCGVLTVVLVVAELLWAQSEEDEEKEDEHSTLAISCRWFGLARAEHPQHLGTVCDSDGAREVGPARRRGYYT